MGTDIHPYAEVRKDGKWKKSNVQIPRDRCYTAFALLADVRNGYGFAGCPTHEPLLPIAEPRGLPEDTDIVNNDADYESPDYVWLGDHSFSWVTLDELKKVDLSRSIKITGIITKEQEEKLKEGITPDAWCGGKSPMTENDVRAEWSMPLKERAWLITEMIKALEPLGNPEDVRMVFGFDS